MLDTRIQVYAVACPGLVEHIQAGVCTSPDIERLLREYIVKLPPDIQAIVLGCTHYPLVRSAVESIWQDIHGRSIHIVDPGAEAAMQIQGWMERKGYV
jgi:glutamate racemase